MPPDPEEMREERRVVTALFADIVGSTALGERLDPEDLRLIVADAIGRMIAAVETFGGTVKDLAGDGMLALFGAPVAHEDDRRAGDPRGTCGSSTTSPSSRPRSTVAGASAGSACVSASIPGSSSSARSARAPASSTARSVTR